MPALEVRPSSLEAPRNPGPRLRGEDDDVLEPDEVELAVRHVLEHVEEEALELGQLREGGFHSGRVRCVCVWDGWRESDRICCERSHLCVVLKGVALEDDARAVAEAGEFLWLELAHRLNVGERELVHVVNLEDRRARVKNKGKARGRA